jgi:hypothetical protein
VADKQTKLSIVIATVDKSTAKIKAINDHLDAITKPIRDFKEALGELHEKSGLAAVVTGFRGVGSAIADVIGKVAIVGGVVGLGTHALLGMVEHFDDLGDKAERLGVGVDFLAQTRYAAERAGASVENLDAGLGTLSKNIGKIRNGGKGKLATFLESRSPALLNQLRATKDSESAFNLLADAMAKLSDPAKKAALAQAAVGDDSLAPLLAKGSKEIQKQRDEYAKLAPGQAEAAAKAGEVDDALKRLKATTDGVKAALVTGLGPALKVIVDRLSEWFVAHRADIAQWASDIGEKLPAAVAKIAEWIGTAYDKVVSFVGAIGGLKNAAIGAGLILAGPLIGSVIGLTGALVTAISRASALGKAMRVIPTAAGGKGGLLGALGPVGLAIAGAGALNELTGGSITDGKGGGVLGLARERLDLEQHGTPTSDVIAQSRAAIEGYRAQIDTQALAKDIAAAFAMNPATAVKVAVDFANAPRGTRVSADPKSTADVDLSVGYQMLGLQ